MCICIHIYLARYTFVATKVTCPPYRKELTQLFMKDKNTNKNKYLKVRVSEDELDKLRSLSRNYHSLSAFILDACWHFQSEKHLRKLELIEEDYLIIENHRKELNRLGSNLNQLIQYTNNCMKLGVYLDNTSSEIIKQQSELLNSIVSLKNELNKREKRLKTLFRDL